MDWCRKSEAIKMVEDYWVRECLSKLKPMSPDGMQEC